MSEEKTLYDNVVGFLKNNLLVVVLVLVFVVITALATLTSSIGTLKRALFGKPEHAPLTATALTPATAPSSDSAASDESQYYSDRRYLPMTLEQYHNKFHDPSLTEYQRLAMTKDYLGGDFRVRQADLRGLQPQGRNRRGPGLG